MHAYTLSDLRVVGTVNAGFPSPAEEENVELISLDEWLIDDPNSTFMIRVKDDSMTGAGILPGDVLLLHRGKTAKNFDIVVATVDDDWTIRYYYQKSGRTALLAANKKYFPILPAFQLKVEGVVFSVIRKIDK